MTGYVLKMFPRFSETFILSEILELERRGRALHVLSLRRPDDGRFHGDVARVRAAVDYLPEHVRCEPGVHAASHARAWRAAPRRYVALLGLALRHRGEAWRAFLIAPLLAERAARAGCLRLHAHFASLPALTAMFAAELLGVRFTFTAHAKDIFLHDRSPTLLRELMRRARRVVTVSEFNAEYLRALAGPEWGPERVVRVYNGIDLAAFRAAPAAGRAGGRPLILAVGRLVEKKGFGDLIRACAELRRRGVDARCEIVGKGPLHDALQRRIAELGLRDRVWLAGPLPRERVADRMREAALLSQPCIVGRDGNRDGLPTVILEAMAAELPVVATRVTGIPEAVEDGVTGRVVEPGRPERLAEALAELLTDRESRARMGRAARLRAERLFDQARNAAELDEVIHGAVGADEPLVAAAPAARAPLAEGRNA